MAAEFISMPSHLYLPPELWTMTPENLRSRKRDSELIYIWTCVRHVCKLFEAEIEEIFGTEHLQKTWLDFDAGLHYSYFDTLPRSTATVLANHSGESVDHEGNQAKIMKDNLGARLEGPTVQFSSPPVGLNSNGPILDRLIKYLQKLSPVEQEYHEALDYLRDLTSVERRAYKVEIHYSRLRDQEVGRIDQLCDFV
ncbi:hypothetical protein MMC28_002757 [Mycoblastus sanguinarius]|nr:hypothetical protein [Mycoblastus sanguinarius]